MKHSSSSGEYLHFHKFMMEIILNNKGGQKLCFAGYMYTNKSTKTNSIQCSCSNSKEQFTPNFMAEATMLYVRIQHVDAAKQ